MGYSEDPADVRVDFFKQSGKWYATESVKFKHYFASWKDGKENPDGRLIHDAFEDALRIRLRHEDGTLRYAGMWAVCLEPYHEHGHPLMMTVPER